MIEPLPGANSSTKNQFAELITIPRDKLPQSKAHTREELGSQPGKDDTPTMAQSYAVLNGTTKALLRPQNSKIEKDGFQTVHRKRTTDSYSDVLTQSQPSMEGSSLTSAAGGLNSASLNE
jgi:hypothetical protein